MLDKSKTGRPGRPWEDPGHLAKARLVFQDQTAARHLRKAIEKKAETAARLKAVGGVPEEV
jgi:hypothetical protein